jgi:uncharacterized protein (TIGR03000 family)
MIKCFSLTMAVLTVLGLPILADSDDKKAAVVIVRLPAEAELIIGGVKSKQQTPVREFDTPPLALGKKFCYELKAVWKDGDKEVQRAEKIVVQAGETTDIDLLKPAHSPPKAEKIPAPDLMPEPEKKPELPPEPVKKLEPTPEPVKKPEPTPEPEKKPEPKPEPEKKPEPKPERIKTPKPKPEPEKKPDPEKPPTNSESRPSGPGLDNKAPAAKGTLSLLMPETLNLRAGGTKSFPIEVVRTDCAGPVMLTFEGLPPGVELKDTTVAADKQKVYLLATASANAEKKEWEVKVIGVSGAVRRDSSFTLKIAK